VFDEAHKIFTDVVYRGDFARVKELAFYPVMKIFLTATLPVTHEELLLEETCMPSSTRFIRAPTTRPNIRYHVLHINNQMKPVNQIAIDLASYLQQTIFTAQSRGIIFCIDIPTVNDIAKHFGDCKSHSQMPSDLKAQFQESWYQGHHQWMVATSGFMHGIDHPDVQAILFIGIPFGAINIEQGAGRAGRSGQPAFVFLLHSNNTIFCSVDGWEDRQCIAAAGEWAQTNIECRRKVMTCLMDGGDGMDCTEIEGAEQCDLCNPNTDLLHSVRILMAKDTPQISQSNTMDIEDNYDLGGWDDASLMNIDLESLCEVPLSSNVIPSSSGPSAEPIPQTSLVATGSAGPATKPAPQILPPAAVNLPISVRPSMAVQLDAAVYAQHMQSRKAKAAELGAMARYLYGKCIICWAWKGRCDVVKTPNHTYFISCRGPEDVFVNNAIRWFDLKKNYFRSFQKYEYCWQCGLPQGKYLPSTHPVFAPEKTVACPFEDFVAVLCWFVFINPAIFKEATKVFPGLTRGMRVQEFGMWAKQQANPGSFYNGLELIVWLWLHRNRM
jgi:Helicase conserved C-terminal domain